MKIAGTLEQIVQKGCEISIFGDSCHDLNCHIFWGFNWKSLEVILIVLIIISSSLLQTIALSFPKQAQSERSSLQTVILTYLKNSLVAQLTWTSVEVFTTPVFSLRIIMTVLLNCHNGLMYWEENWIRNVRSCKFMSQNEVKLVNYLGTFKIYFSQCTLVSPRFANLGDAANLFMLLFVHQVILYHFVG